MSTCLSVRLQVSFIRLRFRYFGRIFSFRTVNSSKESRVVPPTLWFSRKRIDIIFRGRCRPRKLKAAKNNPHVFETKPRKFGDVKISHYTVTLSAPYLYEPGHEKMCVMPYANNKGADQPAQSDQCLCCSLPRQNDTSSLYIRNFKILAGLCSWAVQFVSCLVGDSRRHIFSWRGSYENTIPSAKFIFGKTQMLVEKYDQILKNIRTIKKLLFQNWKYLFAIIWLFTLSYLP